MEKKNLNEKSLLLRSNEPVYIPNGMTIDEFERWLATHGFKVKSESPNGQIAVWIKDKEEEDKEEVKNFYSSEETPSLRDILL